MCNNYKLNIQVAHEIARNNGGKCLSNIYINNKSKLLWQCNKGHKWEAILDSVKRGSWCKICSTINNSEKKKLTLTEMHDLAAKHNGKCLSNVYINSKTDLQWECSRGHAFKAKPYNVKSNKWCPICANEIRNIGRTNSIDYLRNLACSRNGKVLSLEYINAHTKYHWECNNGHQWFATANKIQQGRWCKQCSDGLGERITRAFFEQIFQTSFPKARPIWLRSQDNNQLELDGYSEKLGIAFEHQGSQHYKFNQYFHKTKKLFNKRVRDDSYKMILCLRNGVSLIHIPEIPTKLKINNLKDYIIKECANFSSISLPENIATLEIDLKQAYSPDLDQYLKEIHDIAQNNGGKCLSNKYWGSYTKLVFKCSKNHTWEATPVGIKSGKWCHLCSIEKNSSKQRFSIEIMKNIAKQHNGQCLSTEYKNARTILTWQCEKGHIWDASYDQIKQGSWCRICSKAIIRTKYSIGDMENIAKAKGGQCLSSTYINAHTKLEWQCKNEHTWYATPDSVIHGTWCKVCYNNKRGSSQRLSISEIRVLAENNNGALLSTTYKNAHEKLKWKCSREHIFYASINDIKYRKRWCLVCKRRFSNDL